MRSLIIVTLLFALAYTQTARGTIYNLPMNGHQTDATEQVQRDEALKQLNGLPMKCPPPGFHQQKSDLVTLSPDTDPNCPAEGAIKDHPLDGRDRREKEIRLNQ